jgi:hypothetical protein
MFGGWVEEVEEGGLVVEEEASAEAVMADWEEVD